MSVKELNFIELSSYTTIITGISVLFSIISSIILSIGIGVSTPNGFSVAIYIIPTIVVGTLMYTIYNSFLQGFIYNTLSSKINQIAIKIDGNEITEISTTNTAIIFSIIATIEMILIYLVSVLILPLLLSTVMQTLMFAGQQALAYSIYQLLMLISQPTTILLFIVGTFIMTFVFVLIAAVVYNILGKRGRGIQVNLSEENGFTAVDSINTVSFSIVLGVITFILNLIIAIISLINGADVVGMISTVIVGGIIGLVEGFLFAAFYNFLAPKLGKLKIELIDQKTN